MKLFSNKNTVQKIQAEDNKKDNQNTNFGLASMVVGLVSVVLSCLYAGFLGIIGFILGIVSLIKEEPKKGKAITGIVCSTVAFFISICILVGSSMDLSGYTENKEEQATAEISKEPGKTEKPAETKEPEPSTEPTAEPATEPTTRPTVEPTLSPEEKEKNIKEFLLAGNREDLKEYSQAETHKVAKGIMENLSFDTEEDYETAYKLAKIMLYLYPEGKNINGYEYIASSYEDYININKTMSSKKYKNIEKKWSEVSEAESQIISDNFYVNYDVWANSQDSTLDKIINALTQEAEEYEHAYYANGCTYNYMLDFWDTDDDQEYIIYSHEAFPKRGSYFLKLIPTNELMHLADSSGFEWEVATYTIVSEEDEEKYSRIEKLYNKYESLYFSGDYDKAVIRDICSDFSEEIEEKTNKSKNNKNEVSSGNKDYICPKSNVKKLSVKDVKKLSKADRRLAKNEIYARYGRKFNDENLQEYFNGKSWYTGIIEPEDFDEGVFSKVEKYNIKLLAKYE